MAIKGNKYWEQRLIEVQLAEERLTEEYIDDVIEALEEASNEVSKSTEKYLAIIAVNEAVSLADARRLLDNRQLKEFKYDLKKFREIAIEAESDVRWIKQLENASARVNISRLEALEMSLQQSIEVAKAKQLRITTEGLADVVKSQYYTSIYELQKGIGLESSFNFIDDAQIEKLLRTPWAPDGENFSARIWKERSQLVAQLRQDLTQQLINGQDYSRLVKRYEERFNVEKYKAERLLRTESTYFASQTRLDGYNETKLKKYKYLAILDNRTSNICETLNGQIFNVRDAQVGVNLPSMHPNCRSTTVPVVDFDEDEYKNMFDDQLAKFDNEISLLDWAKEHGVDLSPPKISPPVSVYPGRVKTE